MAVRIELDPVATAKAHQQRFLHRLTELPNGCWVPRGHKTYWNYGVGNHKAVQAHRYSYAMFHGPIPDGLTIDHLCSHTPCVNPWHLEAVTNVENIRRGQERDGRGRYRTHCPAGHPYDAENTHYYDGGRYCRACARVQTAAYLKRKRSTR